MHTESWAQVIDTTAITEDIFQVNFSYEDGAFTHAPGQYIWVVLPELKYPDPRGEQRAFSIASASSESNNFSIISRRSESGYKKTLLSLGHGDRVKIVGPFGSAFVPKDENKRVVMIASGIGISPFLSIVRSLGKTDGDSRYTLICSNSAAESDLFHSELTELAASHHFSYIHHVGNLSESMYPESVDFDRDDFFVCGPNTMVDAVYTTLVKKNVTFAHMHFEQHYPSPTNNLTEEDFIQRPNERNIMLQAVQDSRNHVVITDVNGLVIFANKKAQENTGFTFDEMRGNTPRLWGGLMSVEFYQSFWRRKREAAGFDGELMNRRKNGESYYVLAHISPIVNEKNAVTGYIGTEEDITREKEIDKSKTEFISLASHQLRTPLSTINWYCEMLLSGDAGAMTDEQKKFVGEAYEGSRRMSKLVNALLNVTRIETGTYMVDPQNVDIVQLTRSVLDESKPQIDEKRLGVTLEKEGVTEVILDPNLTTIIMQNLLTNSVKYTPKGGTITITLKKVKVGEVLQNESIQRESLLITMEDNGMGIPTSQKNRVFQKLFRAENVKQSNTDGTGLGLYLVKSLIEHSLGKIWFTSEEKKGTKFFVLLPCEAVPKKEISKN